MLVCLLVFFVCLLFELINLFLIFANFPSFEGCAFYGDRDCLRCCRNAKGVKLFTRSTGNMNPLLLMNY